MSLLLITPPGVFASSHREAPITALDHAADITDFYAFVSYDHPDRVTFIMNVDPFLEPSNGPNYFPFDPNVLYQIKIDNNHDALADVTFNIQIPDTNSGSAALYRIRRRRQRESTLRRTRPRQWLRAHRSFPRPLLRSMVQAQPD